MLPPLTFRPQFKSMLWGGTRLPPLFGHPAPAEPVGEAWVLSDVDGSESVVDAGPLAGRTLRQISAEFATDLYGDRRPADGRFPLLLKFIDARLPLSVQVHPCDRTAPPGKRGKTEAWVVIDRDPATSRLYAGFREGVTAGDFRAALATGSAADYLHRFTPDPGDGLFLPAGTVHAIGADLLLFEVQQTSDVTYRLYDWDRVDAAGKPRELHVEVGLACSDFAGGPVAPVRPDGASRQTLATCEYFTLTRHAGAATFPAGVCRAVVCVHGSGELVWAGGRLPLTAGGVALLPACGAARFEPAGDATLLECGF